jgi:hypothetical protein
MWLAIEFVVFCKLCILSAIGISSCAGACNLDQSGTVESIIVDVQVDIHENQIVMATRSARTYSSALGGVICSVLEIIGGLGLSSRLIVSFQT